MPLTVCIITPEVPSSLRSHGATIIAIAQNFGGRGELGARAADEIILCRVKRSISFSLRVLVNTSDRLWGGTVM